VFFSNSGTEAVEAALKLARAATGRTRLVFVANSYHGKTLGALSVTGRSAHRQPFGPLLPDCVEVPHGDLAALASAVGDAAAFIVEPVLGEGGVILPPDDYLIGAQRLCRSAGAVFVLDEVQTGMGRTGALFAAEHWGLEPDVLCLAKSLSGGLVPIGATLATAAVWDSAYGSAGRATLHSSTFGGGNLAAAAGLATLDALQELDLPARAAKLGATLRRGLAEVGRRFSFIEEVRGIGMMNAVAFRADLSGAFAAGADELLTRLPGNLHEVADLLDDETLTALRAAGHAVEGSLARLLCLRVVRRLARDHHILTFVTANRDQVLRIQPPLVLDEPEADRFVQAMADVATDLSFCADLDTLVAVRDHTGEERP
jgi:acetylornithine/succinyldiaminopimelate/putrescine aminotransferase